MADEEEVVDERDPFTVLYEGLWALVLRCDYVADNVKVGSRIDWSATINPVRHNIAAADLPELALLPVSGEANLHMNSSTSRVIRTYTWMLSTGNFKLAASLFPMQFAIMQAMAGWKSSLTALTWSKKQFVKRLDLRDFKDGESDAKLNRGIQGWSSLLNVEVEMLFTTSDLTGELSS